MNTSFYCRIIIVIFCLAVAFPSPAISTTTPKPAQGTKHPKGESPEELTKKLHEFGIKLAESYNRTVKGSKNKKEIQKNADGTYTAIYHEICMNSINGTFTESSNPKGPVKYIGTLTYAEVTFTNTAPTMEEAEKGPFRESRSITTELVKFVRGNWSY